MRIRDDSRAHACLTTLLVCAAVTTLAGCATDEDRTVYRTDRPPDRDPIQCYPQPGCPPLGKTAVSATPKVKPKR
jgi:hypothetical protein